MAASSSRVMPLATGEVKPEGIALTMTLGSRGSWPARAEMLRRAVQDPAVQGGEWSMAQYLYRIEKGDRRYVGLPVFPLRNFTARDLYVRRGGPVQKAADLTGFYTDFASEELMRLTNLDRRALGKSSLKVDQFLVSLARDREFKCPSNGNTYRGRARDMAVRDYMSHSVKGCRKKNGSPFTIQTILRKHGYSTYTGENIGVNNWPDTGATYKFGCSSSGSARTCVWPRLRRMSTRIAATCGSRHRGMSRSGRCLSG